MKRRIQAELTTAALVTLVIALSLGVLWMIETMIAFSYAGGIR